MSDRLRLLLRKLKGGLMRARRLDDANPQFMSTLADMTGTRPLLQGARLTGRGAYKYKKVRGKSARKTRPKSYSRKGRSSSATVTRNNLFGTSPTRIQRTSNNESNEIVIQNKEYIGELTPDTNLFDSLISSNINPGLNTVFPWLSNIAQFYEEYDFQQLVFEMRSMVTPGNTTSQGSLIMCCQYNCDNPLFTNKNDMEQYEHTISSKVTSNCALGVECNPKYNTHKSLYIRTGPVANNQDLKTYDLGVLQVASQGAYANLNIGELWVTYKVTLRKAKIPPIGMIAQNKIASAGLDCYSVNIAPSYNNINPANQNPYGLVINEPVALGILGYDTCNPYQLPNQGFTVMAQASVDGRLIVTFPSNITSGTYDVVAGFTGSQGATYNSSVSLFGVLQGCSISYPKYNGSGTTFNTVSTARITITSATGFRQFYVRNGIANTTIFPAIGSTDQFFHITETNPNSSPYLL